jgi:hypothetical protein
MPPEISLTLPSSSPAPAAAPASPTPDPHVGSTPGGSSFTRTPIAVAPPSADAKAPDTAKEGDTKTDDAKPDANAPKTESELVALLAKANSEARQARKANEAFQTKLAELETKLAGSTEGSTKAAALEAEINDMLTKPSKYFQRFKAKGENKLAELLEGFAAEDAPEDPRIVALEAKNKERDDREAAEKAERDKNEASDRVRMAEETNKKINGEISAIIASEGVKEDEDGVARWALVSLDPSAPNRARLEVLDWATKEGLIGKLNREQRDDLLCQALDQIEAEARKEALAKAERLRLERKGNKLTNDGQSFTMKPETRYDSSSQRKAPPVNANDRGNLPPPTDKDKTYRHGFTREP